MLSPTIQKVGGMPPVHHMIHAHGIWDNGTRMVIVIMCLCVVGRLHTCNCSHKTDMSVKPAICKTVTSLKDPEWLPRTYSPSYTGWPKKESHFQIIKKSYIIILKPDNEIRLIRQIKVGIKHYNSIRRH